MNDRGNGQGRSVLCLNCGSSSIKFAVFAEHSQGEDRLGEGAVESVGQPEPRALAEAFELAERLNGGPPVLVGHRVVHGGARHSAPARVDAALLSDWRLPLPDDVVGEDVRRYGFHGLSYEYIMSVLGESRPPRVVIAHLGNGASLVAVKDGRAIDTTMGFTPAGGIMMGTRTGDLDPGALIFLAREKRLSPDDLERVCERESGLLAVGGTADMRALIERATPGSRAALAVAMFAYGVRKAIGALAAALGGLDLLVFTGGIGEHAAEVRAEACRGLDMLGVELDDDANAAGADHISRPSSRCLVREIATDEDVVIARHTWRLARTLL